MAPWPVGALRIGKRTVSGGLMHQVRRSGTHDEQIPLWVSWDELRIQVALEMTSSWKV